MIDSVNIDSNTTIYFGDCLEVMPSLASQEITGNLILADIPFGTTNCKWDSIISLEGMWQCLDQITLPNTPILLFAQQPFTSILGSSNIKNLRYNWVWEKTQGTGFLNAKRMPLKCHEDILVFYKKLPDYYPIKTDGHPRKVATANQRDKCNQSEIYHIQKSCVDYNSTERYPRSVLKFKTDKQTSALHPTQKPVALLEYLIKTYTKEGDLVVDFTMGSGSTGIACQNTGRRFRGIDNDFDIFKTAEGRLTNNKTMI